VSDLTGRKPILCLDFDGVCHSYTSGWKGADVIPDAPVDGLFEFLEQATQLFEVNIFSSRSGQNGGLKAMQDWLRQHWQEWIPQRYGGSYSIPNGGTVPVSAFFVQSIVWPTEKPPAFVGIDDRVITFTGNWPSITALKNFKPWNQLGVSGERNRVAG
jgi:hypothetical protein